jgi:DNA-binding PadR family transcriptional regulator
MELAIRPSYLQIVYRQGEFMGDRHQTDDLLPLREEALWLLLALHRGAAHGYALMQAVEEQTDGRVAIQTGALYRYLHRLEADGAIEQVAAPRGETDERRRYYRITKFGRALSAAELRRMRRAIDTGVSAGVLHTRSADT